jgi:uncharacterized membrane protein YphA (DoxX/SURF4 family)
MRIIRICTAAVARFFISAIFLASAVKTILNWHETEKNLIASMCDWQSYVSFSDPAQDCFTFLTPWSPLLLVVATLLMLIGGLSVLLGVKEKWGAFLLILFLIPDTVLNHAFWFFESSDREMQTILFLKNLAILGCLLLMILHGGQAKSGSGGKASFPPFKV